MSAVKRKLTIKTLSEKYEAIRDIERGVTNKEAAIKYGVVKNTISTWCKNKEKLFDALVKT